MTLSGAVIFDRDGVLNRDVGYAHRPEQIDWIDGAKAAVKAVNTAGLLAFVATNQSGVARGYYTEADVEALHLWMNAQLHAEGAQIDAFAYCPHHRDGVVPGLSRDCPSRKPGSGMLQRLLTRHHVDPSRAVMIGDKLSDLEAARRAGVEGVLFSGGSLFEAVRPVIARLAARTAA